MQERLQKIISRAGIASRRAGEELILAGRVRVNGKVVSELGARADLGVDVIEVDGRRLVPEAARYLVLHKPRGVVSTLADPEGRPTVVSLLDGAGTRLYPVGRLDFATSGVLLVTNDGDFANGLLHPSGGVPKTYVVKTRGMMTEDDLAHWTDGITLEDGKTAPADIHFLRHEDGKTWFEITLREGRNQQIRRMGEASGFPVMRLARVSFAGITSEGLRPGQWRSLSLDELLALKAEYGVPKKIRGAQIGPQGNAGERRVRRTSAVDPERRGPRHQGQVEAAPRKEGRRAQRETPAEAAPRRTGRDRHAQAPGRDEGSSPGPDRSNARTRTRPRPVHEEAASSAKPWARDAGGPPRGRPSGPARDAGPPRARPSGPPRDAGPPRARQTDRDRDASPPRARPSGPARDAGPPRARPADRDRDASSPRARPSGPARDSGPPRSRSAGPARDSASPRPQRRR